MGFLNKREVFLRVQINAEDIARSVDPPNAKELSPFAQYLVDDVRKIQKQVDREMARISDPINSITNAHE